MPPTIDATARYLFHMHGSIVEEQGANARGRYGQYRYDWTLEALADHGFVVIGEVRSRTQVLAYANKVTGQVAKLRAAGVPASHITVTGMSKGGAITVLTSAVLDCSDTEAGPCGRYFAGAPGLVFDEVVLDVGRGHALFYTPEPVWVDRVVEFALDRKALGSHGL